MTTPPQQKDLWKNVTWKDDKEKLAFFNHYFKNSSMVSDRIKSQVSKFKAGLIDFIETDKIKDGKEERPITIKDILNKIKGGLE